MTDTGRGATLSRPRRRKTWALAIASAAAIGAGWIALGSRADPERIRRAAELDMQAGRFEEADAGLARLTRPEPRDWLLKAHVAKAKDRPDEALADLDRIPETDPLAARALLLAGQVELRRDRLRVAEGRLRAALGRDPSLAQAHRELIYILSMQLRHRELGEQFRALAGATPLTFDNVYHWCLTRNILWEPHDHSAHLRKFVRADPSDRWSRVALAESLRRIGRPSEARQILSVLPDSDPEARSVLARIALDRGDEAEAGSLLGGGPPDHAELARLRGRLALARHEAPAAVRAFRAAYDAEPENRDSGFGLGASLAMLGDHAAAEPFFQASKGFDTVASLIARVGIPANRSDPALMRELGAACESARMDPEAFAWYSLCIQLDPLDEKAQLACHRLGPYNPARLRGPGAGIRPVGPVDDNQRVE